MVSPTPAITVNRIIVAFNDMLWAREQHLRKLWSWWKYRQLVNRATREMIEDVLENIFKELETTRWLYWGRTNVSLEQDSAKLNGFISLVTPKKVQFWALWTQNPPKASSQG